MNNTLIEKFSVNYSHVDSDAKLRLDGALDYFQEVTTVHSKEMGIDGETTKTKSNAYWVLSRVKLKIFRLPSIYEQIEVETFPTSVGAVKFCRDYTIKSGEQLLVAGTSEWCTLDVNTLAIRRTNTICYPKDLVHREDRSGAGDFLKMREEVADSDFNHTHTSRFCDIDSNKHTNNISYVKMALNCFTPQEFSKIKLCECEISFTSQTYCGDEIRVYKKKTDYGYYIEGKKDDKSVFNLVIKEFK